MFVGCGGIRVGVQVSKREFHTHIHLDYVRIKFISCIKKKKKLLWGNKDPKQLIK